MRQRPENKSGKIEFGVPEVVAENHANSFFAGKKPEQAFSAEDIAGKEKVSDALFMIQLTNYLNKSVTAGKLRQGDPKKENNYSVNTYKKLK